MTNRVRVTMGPPKGRYHAAFACFACRRSFKRLAGPEWRRCPRCAGYALNLGRHFKPPESTDIEQWRKVEFLVDHGFAFHRIHDREQGGLVVPYPKTLREAREFVKRYRKYAVPISGPPNKQLQRTSDAP